MLQVQNTDHRSKGIVFAVNSLLMLTLRPKNFFYALSIVSINSIGKTMTCDLCFAPAGRMRQL